MERNRVEWTGESSAPRGLATIVIVFSRAELMQRNMHEQLDADESSASLSDLFELWTYASLWLALLRATVERWEKNHLFDETVHDLLKSPYAGELRKFRNAVFHGDVHDHADVRAIWSKHREVFAWAETLSAAIRSYLDAELRSEGGVARE